MTIKSNIPGHPGWRKFLLALVRLLIKLLLRVKVTGLHHLPETGPVVIIINHIAFLDPVMVITASPRIVTPLAKIEVLSLPFWGWMSRVYGTIPIRRGEVDLDAMKAALRVLRSDGIILLAPEGTRSRNCQLQPAKDGAIILALRGDAPIVPIGLTGTNRVKANWLKLRRAPITLTVGPAFRLQPAGGDRASRTEIRDMTTQAMLRLAEQLPEEFRGVYAGHLSPDNVKF